MEGIISAISLDSGGATHEQHETPVTLVVKHGDEVYDSGVAHSCQSAGADAIFDPGVDDSLLSSNDVFVLGVNHAIPAAQ